MIKRKLKLKWKIIFSILSFLLAIIICMRFIGTKGLMVREYLIKDNIPSSMYGLKVVHFTDLHYGMCVDDDKLEKLVEKINKTKPDIVFFTGDLIDRNTALNEELEKIIVSNLSKIKSTYGNYYVRGNHDKVNNSYDVIMNKANFISLNNTYQVIYLNDTKNIFIGGSDIDTSIDSKLIEILNNNDYNYKIFIMHYPDNIDNILKYNFNLVLAGHSHNGQVRFPYSNPLVKPDNAKKYYNEYYKISDTNLYISGGIGNSVLNFRLFNRPSFNLYRLVDK